MATTTSATQYVVSGRLGAAAQQNDFQLTLDASSGFTDEAVFAVAKALRDVQWPVGSGITSVVWAYKVIQGSTIESGDLTSNPPAFN